MGQLDLTLTPIWDPALLTNKAGSAQGRGPIARVVSDARAGAGAGGQVASAAGQIEVLDLQYGGADLDAKLLGSSHARIRLNGVPAGVVVKYWADENGFFTYFQNGDDGETPHYVNGVARQLSINGGLVVNLDDKRLRVSNMTILGELQTKRSLPECMAKFGFGSLDSDTSLDSAIGYYAHLAALSWGALDFQERLLGPAAQHSNNPYLRMSVTDLQIARAFKSLAGNAFIQDLSQFDRVMLVSALQKAHAANEATKSAMLHPLMALGAALQRSEKLMPWAPFEVEPSGRYGYGFFAGALDQAYSRNSFLKAALASLTMIRLGRTPDFDLNLVVPAVDFVTRH